MPTSRESLGLIAVASLSAVLFVASFTYSIGHAIDDGIHIVTAQAMATGQGLRLISDPGSPVSTQFPPALSLLLVPVLWIFPHVPDNVIPLKLIPAACAVLFVVVSWYWFRRYHPCAMAFWLTTLVALNPETVRFSGSVIAEMGYGFASVVSIIYLERIQDSGGGKEMRRTLILAILAITAAYLFRSVGLALVLAAVGTMLLHRRWSAAALIAIGFLICASPWLMKGALVGTPEYQEQFWLNDLENPELGTIEIPGLVDRAFVNAPAYFLTSIPNHLFPPLGGQRVIALFQSASMTSVLTVIQISISLLALMGFVYRLRNRWGFVDLYMVVYFGILMIWHTRLQWKYLAPITPILLLYFTQGIQWSLSYVPSIRRYSRTILTCVFALMVMGAAMRSTDYLDRGWLFGGADDPYRPAYEWIKNSTPEDSILMGFDHLALYLYTGRKAVAASMSNRPDVSMAYIQRARADFFVTGRTIVKGTGPSLDEKYLIPVIERYPDIFSLVYSDQASAIDVYSVYSPVSEP